MFVNILMGDCFYFILVCSCWIYIMIGLVLV